MITSTTSANRRCPRFRTEGHAANTSTPKEEVGDCAFLGGAVTSVTAPFLSDQLQPLRLWRALLRGHSHSRPCRRGKPELDEQLPTGFGGSVGLRNVRTRLDLLVLGHDHVAVLGEVIYGSTPSAVGHAVDFEHRPVGLREEAHRVQDLGDLGHSFLAISSKMFWGKSAYLVGRRVLSRIGGVGLGRHEDRSGLWVMGVFLATFVGKLTPLRETARQWVSRCRMLCGVSASSDSINKHLLGLFPPEPHARNPTFWRRRGWFASIRPE